MDNGASSGEDRATHEPSQQAVSAVPVSIPSAFALMQEFYLSRYYKPTASRPADNVQAAIEFLLARFVNPDRDAVAWAINTAWNAQGDVPFPLYQHEAEALADAAIAAVYAIAIEARSGETGTGSTESCQPGPKDAPDPLITPSNNNTSTEERG